MNELYRELTPYPTCKTEKIQKVTEQMNYLQM